MSARTPAEAGALPRRLLATATGGGGHVGPLLPLLAGYAARGDDVLLVGPAVAARMVADAGLAADVHVLEAGQPSGPNVSAIRDQLASLPPAQAAVLSSRELFARLATQAMLPALAAATENWRPDLVLRDAAEYAGAVLAVQLGVPHAQVAISRAGTEWGCLELAQPELARYGTELLAALRTSPYLTRFPAVLDPSPFPDTRRYREPDSSPQAAPPLPVAQWWPHSDAPLVYATLGSMTAGMPIAAEAYPILASAMSELPARVLLTTGNEALTTQLSTHVTGSAPHLAVQTWVAQARVLEQAAVVVCHAGSGTVLAALAAGVPLVVVPLFADQRDNAAQVVALGAGRLSPLADGPQALAAATSEVLTDARYRAAAAEVGAGLRNVATPSELVAGLAIRTGSPRRGNGSAQSLPT